MAKKKISQKKEEEAFYVGISSPSDVRRSLLQSSKDVIQLLKSNELLKSTRVEKAELMVKLKEDIKIINKLINKLKSELPKTKFAAAFSRAKIESKKEPTPPIKVVKMVGPKPKPEKKKEEPKERPAPKKLSELDKLEAELSDVEAKMKSLK